MIINDGAILLIEYENDNGDGVHYNLPAGGVEPGETFVEAVKREAKEEACVDVEVGPVAFFYEYQPTKSNYIYGDTHFVGITFECELKTGHIPNFHKSQILNKQMLNGSRFRSCIRFNCTQKLIKTLLIFTTAISIAIMLKNKR